MGKQAELFEVPLFPLNVVLFPGMALPLHVFEPRYREMIEHCLADNAPFGVVLVSEINDAGEDIPARVGTLARIISYKRLPDGRYNLLTRGMKRFELVELRRDRPYLVGRVRPLADTELISPDMDAAVAEAQRVLRDYFATLTALVGVEHQEIHVPTDPTDLSFVIGMCLTCEDCDKQTLLEMTSVPQRLRAGTRMVEMEMRVLSAENDTDPRPPTPGDPTKFN